MRLWTSYRLLIEAPPFLVSQMRSAIGFCRNGRSYPAPLRGGAVVV